MHSPFKFTYTICIYIYTQLHKYLNFSASVNAATRSLLRCLSHNFKPGNSSLYPYPLTFAYPKNLWAWVPWSFWSFGKRFQSAIAQKQTSANDQHTFGRGNSNCSCDLNALSNFRSNAHPKWKTISRSSKCSSMFEHFIPVSVFCFKWSNVRHKYYLPANIFTTFACPERFSHLLFQQTCFKIKIITNSLVITS